MEGLGTRLTYIPVVVISLAASVSKNAHANADQLDYLLFNFSQKRKQLSQFAFTELAGCYEPCKNLSARVFVPCRADLSFV